MKNKLQKEFYMRSALEVAPDLLGKLIVRKKEDGETVKLRITETEVYMGEEDGACHARAGKTPRTAVMYEEGGLAYIYMIYGLHFLLNVVTGPGEHPQAVLIRATKEFNGPAKLTKALQVTKELNEEPMYASSKLWIEDDGYVVRNIETAPRVGIDYAAEPYKSIPWRFILND